MNIVITLPTSLATLIYEGTKTIEVRKSFPKHFDPHLDVVYICEKGTSMVTGMFSIRAKGETNSPNLIWRDHAEAIAIDKSWLMNYAQGAKKLYLWQILRADRFAEQYPLMSVFGIEKAPQSYAYTAAGWYLDYNFQYRMETNDRKAVLAPAAVPSASPEGATTQERKSGPKSERKTAGTVVPASDFQSDRPKAP